MRILIVAGLVLSCGLCLAGDFPEDTNEMKSLTREQAAKRITFEGAEAAKEPTTLMCLPGDLVFSETFDPDTVSHRWAFKGDFSLRDGSLHRTKLYPTENRRVRIQDASFYNTIIQFDFKFSDRTTDIRLVTGSGGHYNSITQIRPNYFQVNTPSDRDAGFVPSHLGECASLSQQNSWHTMTVEYWNDEMVAHTSANTFVYGSHPIVNRTREYLAFQFDLPGASIDNVFIWQAIGQKKDWSALRDEVIATQKGRPLVPRTKEERVKYDLINVKSDLTRFDRTYQDLVALHESLQSSLHTTYPDAFQTHKQLSKQISALKKKTREMDTTFKEMEIAVNKARKAEDEYVVSLYPDLQALRSDGSPQHRFLSEQEQFKKQLADNGDSQLGALVAETKRLQKAIELSYPEAFKSIDKAIEKRIAVRQSLNDDPAFQSLNKKVVEAGKAVKEYEQKALADLHVE
ncbi:MAG: hypothetical protein ACR2NI_01495 [Pirellulales bacterium]